MLEQLETLATYNRWMNQRLYEACRQLDDAERKCDRGAFFGSVHVTLNHLLLADRAWLARLSGDSERYASRDEAGEVIEVRSLGQVLYADFERLWTERQRTDMDLWDWVRQQTLETLQREIRYRNSEGEQSHPAWWAALHAFNHQTHHRGQITTLLTQRGVAVGATDLIAMLRGS